MRILVDADACPVKEIIVSLAKQMNLTVLMYFDTSHQYNDGYSTVTIVDKGHDSVDYKLISEVQERDIIVTQDYGVASMALAKSAFAINQNGLVFTEDNIMGLLNQRAFHQKIRKHSRVRGPKKRSKENNEIFQKHLKKLIKDNL
jgi:uncharacterized protein YaiI (UPF0178 family)